MALLSISEVARQVGLKPSAIRYYEELGVLPQPNRVSGQRRYDTATVNRLALLRRAQEAGFSLEEVRHFFLGFRRSVPVSARWKALAERKIQEIEERMEQLQTMKDLLQRLQTRCACNTVDECGAGILRGGFKERRGYAPASRR
jgi:MerR family redox-sensitive transcriptional activator SoxR